MSGNFSESPNLMVRRKLDSIDAEIEQLTRALSQNPDGHPDTSSLLGRLGRFHDDRFDLLGELDDIEKAIKCANDMLSLTPEGDPSLPRLLGSLGARYGKRFQLRSEVEDCDKAIERTSLALTMVPDGSPILSAMLVNLGAFHGERFQRLGGLADLEEAIIYGTRAVESTPNEHPGLSARFASLGASYIHRFEHLGELGDLEKGCEYTLRAISLTPDDHPLLPSRLANLGVSLKDRFNRLGELSDLQRAIESESRVLELTPDGHPHLPDRLSGLATSLRYRFDRLGELNDLEKALEYESRALALTPSGHPRLPDRLNNLGICHSNRFVHLGELSDLDKAIEYESQALSLTPDRHPRLPDRLQNLGVSHTRRFRELGMEEDLTKVIECLTRALELTPDGHPNFPERHFPLAVHRLLKYQRTGDLSDLQGSLHSYRMAAQSLSGSPRVKFSYAVGWAKNASKESLLNRIEAYQTAIDLLPQFIWLGATTVQRYEDLTSAQTLAGDAALAAILGSDLMRAVEWLEHARCVVWNQSLMLRSPLDQLHSSYPILAARIQDVANQLHEAGSQPRESQARSLVSTNPDQVAQKHRQLAKEYNDLITETRTLPGFEDFLRPMGASGLMRAARNGPIIILNCHRDRCDALVIRPGRDIVDHIPLPNFTGKEAQINRKRMEDSVRKTRLGERGAELWSDIERGVGFESVLAVLWYDVVKPVLDFLGHIEIPTNKDLPHVTWCPTGALSFLPLHAAGDYDIPESKVFDYVISSYTPTLTALLSSTPSTPGRDLRMLTIGQPNTPHHNPLPGTSEELAYVKSHMFPQVEYSQLVGAEATITTVLDAMEQNDWVHLACHAHQNVQDSTKSGFFLHDGTLDLATINRRSFKNKGMAFLSACQTATGDEKLPDEAIHLASGMLMAGYSSVIATMWSVMDDDAPFVADRVYGQLMKDMRIGSGEAGKALHYAVGELRKKVGEKRFGQWVPYIHIGS